MNFDIKIFVFFIFFYNFNVFFLVTFEQNASTNTTKKIIKDKAETSAPQKAILLKI